MPFILHLFCIFLCKVTYVYVIFSICRPANAVSVCYEFQARCHIATLFMLCICTECRIFMYFMFIMFFFLVIFYN